MHLKYLKIESNQLLQLTDRVLGLDLIFNNYLEDNVFKESILKFNLEYILSIVAKVPLFIFVNDTHLPFLKRNQILSEDLSSIFDDVMIKISIEDILNIELLIILKIFSIEKNNKKMKNIFINVIFIHLKDRNRDYKKIKLLVNLFKVTRKSTIDKQLIDSIFDNPDDFQIFKKKFGNSIGDYLFPAKKITKVVKTDGYENPWLKLQLQINSTYLKLKDLSKKKPITIIHCPICAKQHDVKNDLVEIINNHIIFNCNHENTQFENYKKFAYDCTLLQEDISILKIPYLLSVFFKHNIQPNIVNNVYSISVLNQEIDESEPKDSDDKMQGETIIKFKTKQIRIPVSKFLHHDFSQNNCETIKSKAKFVEFNCPICNSKFFIHLSQENKDHTFNEKKYLHYSKLFVNQGNKLIEFQCSHQGTIYEKFSKFFVSYKASQDDLTQICKIIHSIKGDYIDGKKIIVKIGKSNLYFIDMATFYDFSF